MCAVSLKDRKHSEDLCSLLGIQCVSDMVGMADWDGLDILNIKVKMIGCHLVEIWRRYEGGKGEMCGQEDLGKSCEG